MHIFVFLLSCLKEDNKLFHPLKIVTITLSMSTMWQFVFRAEGVHCSRIG